jgi:hypothetical protein
MGHIGNSFSPGGVCQFIDLIFSFPLILLFSILPHSFVARAVRWFKRVRWLYEILMQSAHAYPFPAKGCWMWKVLLCKTAQFAVPFLLNGFEAYSLTIKEEPGLRAFGNKPLRRINGRTIEEVTETWRKLHNDEFHNLHPLPNFIMVIKSSRVRWEGHVARIWEVVNTSTKFSWDVKGIDCLEDRDVGGRMLNSRIKLDFRETGYGDVKWIHLIQWRLLWTW